ncbi:MAG: aminotransferase class V-fold PLP-dependent enzyme [Candidatus Dormibacteria bacterium]
MNTAVPVCGGGMVPYTSLDNAASTPPLRAVRDAVHEFAEWYSSVHRGAGYKSAVATHAYEEARCIVSAWLGVDTAEQSLIFVKNTTEAINIIANQLARREPRGVITSVMEHHADLLPWRHRCDHLLVDVDGAGRMDMAATEQAFVSNPGRIALLAVSGASNVTGQVNPIHDLAEMAHRHGARILVDAAQLAPHRAIDVLATTDPRHLDFVAISAHKLYAPYGCGALVAPRDFFKSEPQVLGGGAIDLVTREETLWADLPDREEAGSPNVVGAVALACALRQLGVMGMEAIQAHEASLTQCALTGLAGAAGLRIYGSADPGRLGDRLGVIAFNIEGIHHSLVAAALSWEWGIGVRDGCFCAHPYLFHLLGMTKLEITTLRDRVATGGPNRLPGAVRASFAPYNTAADCMRLVEAVSAIAEGGPRADYVQEEDGSYAPAEGWPAVPSMFRTLKAERLGGARR